MLFARSLVATVAIAGIAVPFVLPKKAVPLSTTAIREVHHASMKTVKFTAAVPVQDVRPVFQQRGATLDGRLRAAPTHAITVAANPFENVWKAPSIGGIDLATGSFEVQEVDIALPSAGFSWVVGRSYSAIQETSAGAHRDSDGVQGANWFASSQPCITLYDDATDANDLIYLVYGADRFAELLGWQKVVPL
jgi:hypothetical protein